MPNPKAKNVPKFQSFKSKLSSAADQRPGKSDDGDVETKHRVREIIGKDSNGRRKIEKLRSNHHPNAQKVAFRSQSCQVDDHSNIFILDGKGDEKNLIFGSLHTYSVPKYYRYRPDKILGAQPYLRIDRNLEDEKVIVLINNRSLRNHARGKHIFSEIRRLKPKFLKACSDSVPKDHEFIESDFIPLRPQKRRKVTGEENISSDHDEEGHAPIARKFIDNGPKIESDIESDFGPESDLESRQQVEIDSSVREKNLSLCRQVENCPQDIGAWISLINHQDLLMQTNSDSHQITQAVIRSTAEIKIHMYEKALKHSKSLDDRERLLVGLMSEGEKVWESKTQASRWEQISRDNIDSLVLWIKYLDFKQHTFSMFRYEEVKDVYLQRFKLLSQAVKSHPANMVRIYHELIYVFLRASLFIRESGFSELAVAMWQSALEVNFCGPREDLTWSNSISKFRDFWESEVPRIGEEGAIGWCQNIDAQGTSDIPDPFIDETDNHLKISNIFESWAAAERLRSKTSRIPAKTLDEVAEDDPYRVILFSDVEDFLLFLPFESKELRRSCINAFLTFCRLPGLIDIDNSQGELWHDSFVAGGLLEYEPSWVESHFYSKINDEDKLEISKFSLTPIPNFVPSPESMFCGVVAKQGILKPFKDHYSEDNGPIQYDYIRNSLKLLTQNWPDESLAEYYLCFEYTNEPKTIRKISKSLLKKNAFDFRLYHAYALIEWSEGNKTIAEGVFAAALNIGKSFTKAGKNDFSIMLWKSWIWAYLEEGNGLAALKHLVCIADGVPNPSINISPTLLLRAKQHLVSNRDFFIPNHAGLAVMYSECKYKNWKYHFAPNPLVSILTASGLAILEYLSSTPDQDLACDTQRNIAGSMEIVSSMSLALLQRNQTKCHEILLQSASRLLYCHSQSGPYRPALIREHLTNFLRHFPKNTVFLSLYSWNESRLRIDNRVRNILLKTILIPENDALTSRLFAIQHEIIIGTVHSVKAAFELSLSSQAARLSAGLWRFYILYFLRTPQLRSLSKTIWYRALRACPWAKELYIIGFERMGDLVNFSELKDTWKVMEEKELRVHVDLQDLFEEIEEQKASVQATREPK